jgi:hypothetical protein
MVEPRPIGVELAAIHRGSESSSAGYDGNPKVADDFAGIGGSRRSGSAGRPRNAGRETPSE